MNAQTSIAPAIDRIRHWRALERYSVVLTDGSLGIGGTVADALEKAKAPDAQNVRRAK
jgi:hypothetical protein